MIKLFEDAFTVAVCKTDQFDVEKPEGIFHVLKNGLTYWTADPFPVEVNGELFIFAEMWRYRYLKGCIAYTKLTPTGFTKWKPIIEENFHLSYPNIIVNDKSLYICPESNENGEIFLYECVKFPEQWRKSKVLYQNGKFCDTTFFRTAKDIFGFTYQLNTGKPDELKLFKVEENRLLMSEGNLQTIGDERIRPGGKIWVNGNEELRVVQIGVPTYGSGLLFSKFEIKWPDFKEEQKAELYPEDLCFDSKKHYTGIHTLNKTEHYVIVDLKWNRINLIELFWKSVRKVKKIRNRWRG